MFCSVKDVVHDAKNEDTSKILCINLKALLLLCWLAGYMAVTVVSVRHDNGKHVELILTLMHQHIWGMSHCN